MARREGSPLHRFYAWLGLVGQAVFLTGAVVFVATVLGL
jgi:hypothetical protein